MSIYSELYLDGVEKLSTCALEVDVVAADIINRLEVGGKAKDHFRGHIC